MSTERQRQGVDEEVAGIREASPAEVKAVAESQATLTEETPEARDARLEDDLSAEEILKEYEENPPEFQVVQFDVNGKRIRLPDGNRIVRFQDGKLGINVHNIGKIFVHKKGKVAFYTRIDLDTFAAEKVIGGWELAKMYPEACAVIEGLYEGSKPKIFEKIDPEKVQIVDNLRRIQDRRIVKLAEGPLAIEHTMRNSYFAVYGKKLIEYDANTGERYDKDEEHQVSQLKGPTKAAYEELKRIKVAKKA